MTNNKFPKYELNNKQIQGLANIIIHQQGTVAGIYAQASLMANLTDIKGDQYATVDNLIKKATSGWFAYGRSRYNAGTNNKTAIKAIIDVIVKGKRTLPRYINEHDCLSDLTKVTKDGSSVDKKNKDNYIKHKTVLHNKYGSTYTFYSFPGGSKTGVDPFGYTSKPMREKWGEFCYTLQQSQDDNFGKEKKNYTGIYPVLPDSSFKVKRKYYKFGDGLVTLRKYTTQIKRVQQVLKWGGFYKGPIDGIYGLETSAAVKKCQKYFNLDINGCFGQKCLKQLKTFKR